MTFVHRRINELYKEYVAHSEKSECQVVENNNSAGDSTKNDSGIFEIDKEYFRLVNAEISLRHGKFELDAYLEENVYGPSLDFDVLSWWKSNVHNILPLQKWHVSSWQFLC